MTKKLEDEKAHNKRMQEQAMNMSFIKKAHEHPIVAQQSTPEQENLEVKPSHHRTVSKDSSVRGGVVQNHNE